MADNDIQVKFGAQIEGLLAGVKEAKESIAGITEPIAGIKEAFADLAEVAGVALAFEGFAESLERYAELGEQIERTAKITGASTSEVQEFQFAVKMSGGDAETASMSLNRFGRNVADAAKGTGTAAEAFTKLGINVTDASGHIRPLMDVLGDVAQRFSETADGATKLEYATALGSRGFASLIPYLDQGREGLERLKDELDETGAKMSPEQVEKARGLKESLNILDSSWQGLKNTMASEAAPAFQAMVDLSTDLVQGLNSIAKAAKDADGVIHRTAGGMLALLQITQAYSKLRVEAPKGAEGGYSGEPAGGKSMSDLYASSVNGIGEKDELSPLSGKQKEEKDSAVAIAQNDAQTQLAIQRTLLQGKKDILQEEVSANQISKAQELAELQTFLDQEYYASYNELEKELAIEGLTSEQKNAIRNKELILTAQYFQQTEKLSAQAAAAQAADAKKVQTQLTAINDLISRDFDTMLQGILQGTTTWQAAMDKLFSNLAVSFIEAVAKMIEKWLAFEALTSFGVTGLVNPLSGGISGLVGGALGIKSYDVGSWSVPSDQLAYIHKDEMIVPAQQAGQIRSGGASLGGGAGNAGDNYNVTVQLNAIDTQTGTTFLQQNMGVIAQGISQQIRNMNPKLTGSLR